MPTATATRKMRGIGRSERVTSTRVKMSSLALQRVSTAERSLLASGGADATGQDGRR